MKITFHASMSGYWWDGNVHSAIPGQPVEVDDANPKAVAWARHSVASGAASLIEDVKAREPAKAAAVPEQPKAPARAPARAEPKASPARPGKPAAGHPGH